MPAFNLNGTGQETGEDKKLFTLLASAFEEEDEKKQAEAFGEWSKELQARITVEAAKAARQGLSDDQIMANRGFNVLTTEEKAFYEKIVEAKALDNLEVVIPVTVYDRIFDMLEQEHALLRAIDFVNTTGITRWLMRKAEAEGALWSDVTAAIVQELSNGFEKIEMGMNKLTSFIPVYNSTLDLGPVWIDRFIVTLLSESLAIGLEKAIISGTGNNMPIGMDRDLNGAVVGGVYPQKPSTPITDLLPATMGGKIMAPLTFEGRRAVSNILMIVNPLDYWNKIFPAMTFLNAAGQYVQTLPINATPIQSPYVESGKMIVGMPRDYFMGMGTSRSIESSKHYRFLEDQTVYAARLLANGKPKDNRSFIVFDISELKTLQEIATNIQPTE